MSTPRLYLDEDVSTLAATMLRAEGFDAVSAHEVGTSGWTDERQLGYAAAEGRVLFSYNARHFDQIAKAAADANQRHAGILVSYQQYKTEAISGLVRRLSRFLKEHEAEELKDVFLVLPSV